MSRDSAQPNIVFLHHSVGRQLIATADLRARLLASGIRLTDVDYNRLGTTGPEGERISAPPVPYDDTDIPALADLLDRGGEFVDWLASFDVVVMKSCYPNSNLKTDSAALKQRQEVSRILSAASNRFRSFLWVTPPPLPPLRTSVAAARRARDVALSSSSTASHVMVFDLHGSLADDAGMLSRQFRRINPLDAHPNKLGALSAGRELGTAPTLVDG